MKHLSMGALWLCLSLTSQAQSTEGDTLTASYLDEVVVSAHKWEQNLREVSARIATVNSSLIRLQNPQTAADLLGLSNQVFIQKSQLGGGSPIIRGFATNRVLLVVDGVRMNNAIFRGGNVQNVISLDANAIRETEVIFGPGSVIYGSDAIGGVMDFHTLRPVLAPGGVRFSGSALARYATANQENTGHVDFNIGMKNVAFMGSITRSRYNDLRMGSRGPTDYQRPDYQERQGADDVTVANPDPDVQVNSGYDQVNGMGKVLFKPNATWDVTYAFHYSKTSDVPRYDRLILKNTSGVFANAEWYYGPQTWLMHVLTLNHAALTPVSNHIRLTAAFQDYRESRHTRNFSGSNRNRLTERFENVKAFSFNLDADKLLSERTSLFYGAEFVANAVASSAQRKDITTQVTSPVSTRYPNGSDWRSVAAYASVRHIVNEHTSVNASVRYTQVHLFAPFDTTFFPFPFTSTTVNTGAANGSVGVTFNPTEVLKVYFNLSSGFRAPNIDDIGRVFDSQPGSVVVPNPGLAPETAYTAEVGFTGQLAAGLSVDFATYYTLLDDAIVRSAFLFNGEDSIDYDGRWSQVLALQNINRVKVMGAQLSARYEVSSRVRVESSLNIQDGEERDPLTNNVYQPTHIAPTFGSTTVSYQGKKLRAVAYVNYQGRVRFEDLALTERADAHLYAKDSNGNPHAPAWTTWNVKGSYTVGPHVTVDVGVENIFDKRYRPYASGISAPGRNLIFALRAKI